MNTTLRFVVALLATLTSALPVLAQNAVGNWAGDLIAGSIKLPLIVHVTQEGDTLKVSMDSPQQGVKGIPLTQLQVKENQLTFEIPKMGVTFNGTFDGADSIKGIFTQGGQGMPLTLTRVTDAADALPKRPQEPQPPYPYRTIDVTFPSADPKTPLQATLTLPQGKGRYPAVVLVTGSGTQNRDEEILGHKPFKVIADHLTRQGIAVLRYDDRQLHQIGRAHV